MLAQLDINRLVDNHWFLTLMFILVAAGVLRALISLAAWPFRLVHAWIKHRAGGKPAPRDDETH